MKAEKGWRRTILGAALLVSLVARPAAGLVLPDTGQTKCYQTINPYAEMPCAGTGQDGEYTTGSLSYTVPGDGTVTDNNTGLTWQQDGGDTTYNWYQASGTYEAIHNPTSLDVCGALNLGAATDWRLPSLKELMGLVDYGRVSGLMIQEAAFPNAKGSGYWTATPAANISDSMWWIDFYSGHAARSYMSNQGYVRCVRGVAPPAPALTNNGDGTVTDARAGLIWQQAGQGSKTWTAAVAACETLNFGGSSAWRLPNIKEVESLADDTRRQPAVDQDAFPGITASTSVWSSTTYTDVPSHAWLFGFGYGEFGEYSKTSSASVWCVRSVVTLSPHAIQTPAAGAPGATFQQSGTGFTPNSNGEFHVRRPDGIEETPFPQPVDADGNFTIGYTAAADKAPGNWTWWVVDGPTRVSSNEVVYTIDPNIDSDGDALPDDWEINGHNGLDLKAMGADPMHKDVFVEVDWMENASHSDKPSDVAVGIVVRAFKNAPVKNPDGTTGINLHVDTGSLGGGNSLVHDKDLNPSWTEYNKIKWVHFNSAQRAGVFHYCVFGHQYDGGGSSGVSWGLPGADFIVTLGAWYGRTASIPLAFMQAGTFMHELGHNLGLRHGGQDNVQYKPNYLSIMNYSFQMTGLISNGKQWKYDFGRFGLADLNENALYERAGLNPDTKVSTYGTRYRCGYFGEEVKILDAGKDIDWDCDGIVEARPVSANINDAFSKFYRDGKRVLRGRFTDWDNLMFNGVGPQSLALVGPPAPMSDELTVEEFLTNNPEFRRR